MSSSDARVKLAFGFSRSVTWPVMRTFWRGAPSTAAFSSKGMGPVRLTLRAVKSSLATVVSAGGVAVRFTKRSVPSVTSTLRTVKAGSPAFSAGGSCFAAGFAVAPPSVLVLRPRAVSTTVMAGERSTT